ncbi:MAG: flagellar filament capping protein FliD [Tissierellia bacterium]|nr:flagellar filament capping protein FliD [Tissierellia bacterium]
MSILSTSIYGSTINKGVGGLLSGLETDELVNQMAAGTRNKINRAYQSKQKLVYRQEAYREISSKLLSFSNKYLSFSSSQKTNLLSSKFFESYSIKSSSEFVNVSGNGENIKNFTINEVSSVATNTSFTSEKKVSNQLINSSALTQYTSSIAGETMTIEHDGKKYSITIDSDFGKGLKTADGIEERNVKFEDVIEQLNKQLAKIPGNEKNEMLKYELHSETGDSYKIIIKTTDETKIAKLSAASNNLLNVLKMEVGKEASSQGYVNSADLTKTASDILSNKDAFITFDYNGVQKTVNLNESITDQAKLKDYLQNELNKLYGSDKIEVALNSVKDKDGNDTGYEAITFKTTYKEGQTVQTDLIGVTNINRELGNYIGIKSGTYNRFDTNKSLREAGISCLEDADVYKIEINGEEMSFDSSMSVADVINAINNNAKAGIKLFYSSTTDTFSVKSTETGANEKVTIRDVSGNGNLATALFGTGINNIIQDDEYIKYENGVENIYKLINGEETLVGNAAYNSDNKEYYIDYNDSYDGTGVDSTKKVDFIIHHGTDTVMTYTLNGVEATVTRSTANFNIDDMNISLNEKAKNSINFENPATFQVNSNTEEIIEKVREFINEYNEIIDLIGKKTSERPKREYLPLTPEQMSDMEKDEIEEWTAEAKKGALYGDSNMQNILNKLKNVMFSKTSVSSLSLSDIGISTGIMDRSGKLNFDEEKFKTKLEQNQNEVQALFTGRGKTDEDISGISHQLQGILRANIGFSGTTGILIDEAGLDNGLTSDKNSISLKMKEYDKRLKVLKKSLEEEKERYWKRFSALEQALNNLNAQSSWLTDMMGGN